MPACLGRACGPDGCGGTCGPGCGPGSECDDSTGTCRCVPYCPGRVCGPDGCGGTCPPGCGPGSECDEPTGTCRCVPFCDGRVCGPDGCGGACPPGCRAGHTCDEPSGTCGCTPACGGRVCGPDACGGTCGPGCGAGETCDDATGQCRAAVAFSFAVYGDTQFATASCTSGIPERLAVPKALAALDPAFVMHTGDLVDHAYEDGAYENFRTCSEPMLAAVPFFPTSGNHDMGSAGILKYRAFLEDQLAYRNPAVHGPGYDDAFEVWYGDDPATYSESFDAPGDKSKVPSGVSFETFYAFRHANSYFVSFEQGTRWWTNTPKAWVEKHLAAARADPTIDHVFVWLHHPFYSTVMADTADGECMEPVRKHYEALFRKYDVTLVFSGHAHLYEHFEVPDAGGVTRADPHPTTYSHDGTAIHYIVTGGGGGPLNKCPTALKETSWDYFQGRACAYHVTHVKVDGKSLSVEIVKVSGSGTSWTTEVIDSFALVP
ncbi:MAG: metallophosphoesterase [Deltaproteobacteria bacterium]|nr:metallophosphoesterase [Deltaproteobacteria bacterium]